MKRALYALSAGLLALGLTSCSAGPATPTGGRPELPTGVEVRFPAAPAKAYLSLLDPAGQNVYQLPVPTGATRIEVDPPRSTAQTQSLAEVLPAGIVDGTLTLNGEAGNARVRLLRWVMWQDGNDNGTRDSGEELPLMTHDRLVYSDKAIRATFRTTDPDMAQRWNLAQGWSRAEHYVYRPLDRGEATYIRLLESSPLGRYTLHLPTPVTSQ